MREPSADSDEYEEYYDEEDMDVGDAAGARSSTAPANDAFTKGTSAGPRARGECINHTVLPQALEDALVRHSLPRIQQALRAARQRGAPAELSVDDFLASRLDLSFAACYRTLHEVRCRLPTFAPSSVLEVGAGVAPGCWAAHTLWPEQPAESYVAIEPNRELQRVGAELSGADDDAGYGEATDPAPEGEGQEDEYYEYDGDTVARLLRPQITWRTAMSELGEGLLGRADESRAPASSDAAAGSFDLVIAPYVLTPLPTAAVGQFLETVWRQTAAGGVLVLVEPSSEEGLAAIKQARELLYEVGGDEIEMIAPFPRVQPGAPYPSVRPSEAGLAGDKPWDRWLAHDGHQMMRADRKTQILQKASVCMIEQRIRESRARQLHQQPYRRGGERRFVRESFAYLVFARQPVPEDDGMWGELPFARVVTDPRKRRKHVLTDVVLPDGSLRAYTLTKSRMHPKDWRFVRKLQAGETVPLAFLQRPMY